MAVYRTRVLLHVYNARVRMFMNFYVSIAITTKQLSHYISIVNNILFLTFT